MKNAVLTAEQLPPVRRRFPWAAALAAQWKSLWDAFIGSPIVPPSAWLVRPRGLRTYLSLFAAALTFPLLALAAVSFSRMANLERAQLERRVEQVAQDLSRIIDRDLDRPTTMLETLATSHALITGDFAAFHAQATLALQPDQVAIFLLDRNLKELVNTHVSLGSPPSAPAPASAGRVLETREPQVSGLIVDSGSKLPVIVVQVPVFAERDVRYILGISVEASHFAALMQRQNLEAYWITGLTDTNGIIISRSERHREFVGRPLPKRLFEQSVAEKGPFRAVSVAGEHVLRVTARANSGWLVSATIPEQAVKAMQSRGMIWLLVFAVAALLCGALLAMIFAGVISRPLAASTNAAEALGRGAVIEPLQSPLIEANVLTDALSKASHELAERRDHVKFLMKELAHRSKNLLTVVSVLARQTGLSSGSIAEFERRLGERLRGLARSQDELVQQDWKGADLASLIRRQLQPFVDPDSGRVQIQGERVVLRPEGVQNIGMAFHELATNASKYGSLSVPNGSVVITWSLTDTEDGRAFNLEWLERGGPTAPNPTREGFGRTITETLVPQSLGGKASSDYFTGGLQWRLTAPAERVVPALAAGK
jgi:two-component sensor histidine kinase